jgi:hypothetical protein
MDGDMASTAAIGPWTGGLNLTSNRDLSPYLKDSELGIATNVQLTSEGFVESRPGFKILEDAINEIAGESIRILGSILVADQEVIVVQVKSATQTFIYYIKGDKTVYLKATFGATPNFSSVLAINQSSATIGDTVARGIFLFDSAAKDACYRLEESPTFTSATPVLMNTSLEIPKSDFSFSVKDRIFLIDAKQSKIYWSALVEGCLWFDMAYVGVDETLKTYAKSTGFIQTEPSLDSTDNITSVEFLNNSFYMFKRSATYLFTFQADPEADGYLRKISDTLGAYDSTVYRNTVVVINNRGVFSVEGTEFIDLQVNLNLRAEEFIDTASPNAFITDFNGNVLIGYTAGGTDFYYVLNGVNNGWTKWDFTYALPDVLAAPGSNAYTARLATDTGIILFTNMDRTKLVFCYLKPSKTFTVWEDYALDTRNQTANAIGDGVNYSYIPAVDVQARTILGDSVLNYKKIYRTYVRLYISDIPAGYTVDTPWKFSINYNDYILDVAMNPVYSLYVTPQTTDSSLPGGVQTAPPTLVPPAPGTSIKTAVYKRTYQIPFSQQRAREFTFQLKRPFSKLTDITLENELNDRPIQEGFYFLLSGFWVDYEDKARI